MQVDILAMQLYNRKFYGSDLSYLLYDKRNEVKDMTLKSYIEEQFPIDKIIEQYNSDPIAKIMEADCLPYDKICMYDGKLQKVVEISEDEVVPVFDLVSLTEADITQYPTEFKEVYKAYMDNIEIEDVNVMEILDISRRYRSSKEQKRSMW